MEVRPFLDVLLFFLFLDGSWEDGKMGSWPLEDTVCCIEYPKRMSSSLSSSPLLLVPPSGPTASHAFRLTPKAPLKRSLCECANTIFARSPSNISALFVMTVVGSLRSVKLRLANASRKPMGDEKDNEKGCSDVEGGVVVGGSNEIREWKNERFEIVSLVGTFSRDGSCHLHLSIADADGNTYGGHLIEGEIFTTAEVVLGAIEGVDFKREHDPETGYNELSPRQIPVDDANRFWSRELYRIAIAACLGFVMGASYVERKRLTN